MLLLLKVKKVFWGARNFEAVNKKHLDLILWFTRMDFKFARRVPKCDPKNVLDQILVEKIPLPSANLNHIWIIFKIGNTKVFEKFRENIFLFV